MNKYSKHFSFAFRMMAKTPLVTALSVLVLAISIAQVTMMFNMFESVIMADLPYEGGDRIMRVHRINPENRFVDSNVPFQTYHQLLEQQKVFSSVIGLFSDNAILQTGMKQSQEAAAYVSSDFLEFLGVDPILGRGFTEEDALAESPPVILISSRVWEEFFGGRKDIIGQTVMADGISRTVIGVLPRSFDFPFLNHVWVPLNTDTLVELIGWGSSVFTLGKLHEGVSIETADEQINQVFTRIKEDLAVENEGISKLDITPLKNLYVNEQTRMLFMAMGICALLVLFMGCGIVSNLTTVRSVKRSNELAIRTALGASRWQIVFQMLFEAMILSVFSFVLGWLFMDWFNVAVLESYYLELNAPAWFFGGGYNLSHFIFILVVLFVVTVASTLIPALRASKTNINDLLKDSSRTGSSVKLTVLGKLLIMFQIAAAVAVVTGGAIVGYFLHDVSSQESEFDKKSYLFAQLSMNANTHGDPKMRVQLMQSIKEDLESKPGVLGVTYSTEYYVPNLINTLRDPEKEYSSPDAYPKLRRRVVAPDYFKVMSYELIAGREFTQYDDLDHPQVIIVTDVLARQFFGNENPIGKQLLYAENEEFPVTIIGVVKDLFHAERDRDKRTGFYRSTYQDVWFDSALHIHASGNPMGLEPDLVRTIGNIDARAVVTDISTIFDREQSFLLSLNFIFVLFMTFSIGALIMASAGLYGVLSFSVAQQIREIGIRLALGAAPSQIVFRVFKQGMKHVWIGGVLGIVMAFVIRYLLASILDPLHESIVVYLGVLLSVLAIALFSMLIPAVRGGLTDPADALRID